MIAGFVLALFGVAFVYCVYALGYSDGRFDERYKRQNHKWPI